MQPAWSAHPSPCGCVVGLATCFMPSAPPPLLPSPPRQNKRENQREVMLQAGRTTAAVHNVFDSSVYICGAIQRRIISARREAVWRYTNTAFHLTAFSCWPETVSTLCQRCCQCNTSKCAEQTDFNCLSHTNRPKAIYYYNWKICSPKAVYNISSEFKLVVVVVVGGVSSEGQIKWSCSIACQI